MLKIISNYQKKIKILIYQMLSVYTAIKIKNTPKMAGIRQRKQNNFHWKHRNVENINH